MAARSRPTGGSPKTSWASSRLFSRAPGLGARTQRTWPFLSPDHARRLASAYGTRVDDMLKTVKEPADLGLRFGADLTAAEVRYLMTKEWAQTADDVLWRRSKLGLRFTDARRVMLDRFMAQTNG